MNLVSVTSRSSVEQRWSNPARIALGASIVGALLATAGVVALLILSGSLELSTAVSYLCWLGSVAALRTRRNVAGLVSAALTGIILVLLVNQPYATGSLLNPSEDYGQFAGVVLIVACALLAFGGSLVASVRSFRNESARS